MTYWKEGKVIQERITEQHTMEERWGFWDFCSRLLWRFAWTCSPSLRISVAVTYRHQRKHLGLSLKLYYKLSTTHPPKHYFVYSWRSCLASFCTDCFLRGPWTWNPYSCVRACALLPFLLPVSLPTHSGPFQFCHLSEAHLIFHILCKALSYHSDS